MIYEVFVVKGMDQQYVIPENAYFLNRGWDL